MTAKLRAFLRDFWTLAAPYWSSEERWKARGLLLVVVSISLFQVYLLVQLNTWNRDFFDALQQFDQSAFMSLCLRFAVLAGIFIAAAVYGLYLQQMLQIRWRRWLTDRYVGDWLADRAYYRMRLRDTGTDNPDQRIADDLRLFVDQSLTLSLGLLSQVVRLASFVAILWGLSGEFAFEVGGVSLAVPGFMVWAALGYSIVGTWLTHWIGKPLPRLNFNQQRYEADFRFSLVRVRESAEGIALYRGEGDEARRLSSPTCGGTGGRSCGGRSGCGPSPSASIRRRCCFRISPRRRATSRSRSRSAGSRRPRTPSPGCRTRCRSSSVRTSSSRIGRQP
jgi:putative ATP-binding cassette transporter